MNLKYFNVGDTIYRIWLEFDGPKGESYIIEEKISDYAFKVKDRNGKISVLMYPKDNIILFPDNARTIYDTYKKEWEFLNDKKIKKSHTHNSSNKNTITHVAKSISKTNFCGRYCNHNKQRKQQIMENQNR